MKYARRKGRDEKFYRSGGFMGCMYKTRMNFNIVGAVLGLGAL
jgi:hypothetical protein